MVFAVNLAVDIMNSCSYCINFDISMRKQLGYDDAKIDDLLLLIGLGGLGNLYADGLQLEPDVTPEIIERRKTA